MGDPEALVTARPRMRSRARSEGAGEVKLAAASLVLGEEMDDAGYREAVLEIKDRVYSYSAYLLQDAEEARDVAQEALVRLWQHRSAIPGIRAARAWTLRTAHNLAIDRLRVQSARPSVDAAAFADVLVDRSPGPERRLGGREGMRDVGRALAELCPEDRAVLLMREVEAMAYDEIAAACDAPLGTIKARLHRARARLRGILRREGVSP
jgi:RNA polymerase sigma-70 factor (ECF subfamily)